MKSIEYTGAFRRDFKREKAGRHRQARTRECTCHIVHDVDLTGVEPGLERQCRHGHRHDHDLPIHVGDLSGLRDGDLNGSAPAATRATLATSSCPSRTSGFTVVFDDGCCS